MKRVMSLILPVVLLFFASCDKDVTSTKSGKNGFISFVIDSKEQAGENASNSKSAYGSTSSVSELEVRVLQSDGTVIVTETFTPVDGLFDVTMEVIAEDNLQVLCLGFSGGEMAYFGIDADVDVQEGETATAYISGWDNPYVTEITDVSPNMSITGDFQVTWTQAPNATLYILQQAISPLFENATTIYSGVDRQYTVFGNTTGHYYLRVQASNKYDIVSSWSNIDSLTVNRNLPVISGTISGADSVLVTLSRDSSDTQTINDGETYSFIVNRGGTYTITPTKQGYVFIPESQTVEDIAADQILDFTANEIKVPFIDMVYLQGGTFRMGDISGDGEQEDELPVHEVSISAFEIGKYEITQEQYGSVIGEYPSHFTGEENLPLDTVTWNDAVHFCNTLSEMSGLTPCYDETTWECDFSADGYRLPTEAEWEYACRAGTETIYYTGNTNSDLARAGWYGENSGNEILDENTWNVDNFPKYDLRTHPVGLKEPNAFGLYDMHGNVFEYCNDWYDKDYYSYSSSVDPVGPSSGSQRVMRGGFYGWYAKRCPSALRAKCTPSRAEIAMGFRVVRRP